MNLNSHPKKETFCSQSSKFPPARSYQSPITLLCLPPCRISVVAIKQPSAHRLRVQTRSSLTPRLHRSHRASWPETNLDRRRTRGIEGRKTLFLYANFTLCYFMLRFRSAIIPPCIPVFVERGSLRDNFVLYFKLPDTVSCCLRCLELHQCEVNSGRGSFKIKTRDDA